MFSASRGIRNGSLESFGRDSDAVAGHGLGELLAIHKDRAFEAASIAKILDSPDVLRNRKWKLQSECNEAKNELHREEPVDRHILINPVRNPCVQRLVLVVAESLAHQEEICHASPPLE